MSQSNNTDNFPYLEITRASNKIFILRGAQLHDHCIVRTTPQIELHSKLSLDDICFLELL